MSIVHRSCLSKFGSKRLKFRVLGTFGDKIYNPDPSDVSSGPYTKNWNSPEVDVEHMEMKTKELDISLGCESSRSERKMYSIHGFYVVIRSMIKNGVT